MVFSKERREILSGLTQWFAVLWLTSSAHPRRAVAEVDRQAGMRLLPPQKKGRITVEEALEQRRTVRAYQTRPLKLEQLSQLLWAAQGLTGSSGYKRAAPSAGALYPMDVYAVLGQDSVAQIEAGVYRYEPQKHALSEIARQDVKDAVAKAALGQMWMAKAPVNLIITAEYRRVTGKYHKRGERYAMIEAGHIGQNIFLQAQALGLRAGIVGAFRDQTLKRVLKIPPSHEPLLIMPVGYGA
ncbi:MAG: SagB/ThcOx family dehydrogenase [Desulfobacteraceae bacterium]|jgi:SagB-type dehydrogenase family enzyme